MRRLVAVLVAFCLAFTGLFFAAPALAVDGEAKDVFSARVIAKSTQNRVLVTGLLDEFSTTYVNPDGSLTTDSYGSAIRVRDDRTLTGWRDLDYSLMFNADGSVSPRSGLYSLFISGGGSASQVAATGVVRVTSADGSVVGFSWPGALPKPVLGGPKATYIEVLPGVDLVVEANSSGFEQFFVLKQKPSAEVLAALELPLKMKKVSAVENADGSFTFENAASSEVASLPTPRVWDSSFEPKSGSAVEGVLDANLNRETNTVELAGLGDFLENPDLVYPVTVDPALTLNPLSDNYVRDDTGAVYWSSTELLLGTYDGGVTRARSYIRFRNTQWAGKQITAATLKLYETWSYSCNTRNVYLYPAKANIPTSWSWAKQPTLETTISDSVSAAKGYSSACSAGWISINAKDVTTYLASHPEIEGTVSTIAIRASETDSYGWKRFTSTNGTNKPVLSVTYNNVPTKPSQPVVTPGQFVGGNQFATSLMPTFSAQATDGDKDTLRYHFGFYADAAATVPYQDLCSVYVFDSGPGTCSPTFYLSDNTTYYVKVFADDMKGELSLPLSDALVVKTAASLPAQPTISCPGYSNGSNSSLIPTSTVECVVTVSKQVGVRPAANVQISVNSGEPVTVPTIDGALTYSVSLPAGQHGHVIQASSVSLEGLKSADRTFTLSFGEAGIYSPTSVTKTSSTVKVSAFVNSSMTNVSSAYIDWSTVDGSIHDTKTISLSGFQTFAGLKGLFDYRWNAREVFNTAGVAELADGGAVAITARVCFTFQSTGINDIKCTPSDISLLVVPHAFNAGNPTSAAGSGTVALLTGELQLGATDASQSLPEGALSISRQYLSYDGTQTAAQAVFGQGWRASFTGIDSGAATLTVADTTASQKLITLSDPNGETLVYQTPAGKYGASPDGTYVAYDKDTQESFATLTVSTTTPKVMSLIESNGRVTKWNQATLNGKTLWLLDTITEATGVRTNSYTYDSNGRVIRILGPAPTGIPCNLNSETAGCKALYISYAANTNSVIGDFAGQVKSIDFKAYDPVSKTMLTKTVATYKYDATGYLTSVTDPRSNVTTSYSYTTNSLTQVKLLTNISQSTNLAATTYQYDSQARLLHVALDKADKSAGLEVVATFVYDVQNGQTILPSNTAALWGQTLYPKNVAAVFGPEAPASVSSTADNLDLTTLDANTLKLGIFYFTNNDGLVVNQASFGSTRWNYTFNQMDDQNRTTAAFDQNGLNQIITLNNQGLLGNYNIYRFATVSKYAPAVFAGDTQVDGGQLIETWQPAKPVLVAGSVVDMRLHTVINYNEGEPATLLGPDTNIHYGLETSRITTLADAESSNWNTSTNQNGETFVSKTVQKYAPIGSTPSGWAFGQPTITQSVDASGNVISERQNVFDVYGRTVKTTNTAVASNDLLTDYTTFYTATANSTIPSCGLKPEWNGLVCVTGSANGLGRQKPDRQITAYDYYLRPTTSVDTIKYISGTTTLTGTKTTTTSYVATGAAFGSVATTQTNSKNGTAAEVAGTLTTSVYDTSNGLLLNKTAGSSSFSYTYDNWGRKLTLTNKPDSSTTDTTTWAYMPTGLIGAGQIASVSSTKASYFYGYGGAGETRNLPTTLNVSGVGEYTAVYNQLGQMVNQTAPGGVSQSFDYDTAGRAKTMSYLGTVDNAGVPVTVDWMDFTRTYDPQNRVAIETTPAAFPAIQNDTVYTYEYDVKNRLTSVDQVDNTACVNRAYSFDASGNRTSKTTTLQSSAGLICASNSPIEQTATQSLSYNNYSQLTTLGYVYDVFGRATTVPSGDTANQAGNVTLTYSPEDRILSQKQGTTQTDYNYDALGRRYQDKLGTTVKTTRHYADESDNPTWVSGTGTTAAQIDIYTPALATNLNATRKVNGTTTTAYLNFSNLHGDTITSLELPSTGYVSGPNELNVYDEYGIPQAPELDNRPTGVPSHTDTTQLFVLTYGSLGQPQRETSDSGIQFMGARGFNPITGQFLTPDPIPGGNETAYNYPNNPVCNNDLTGMLDLQKALSETLISLGVDALAIAGCMMFAAACLAISIGIGMASGGIQGYFEGMASGHTGLDLVSDVAGGAVFGGVASGVGATLAKPAVSLVADLAKSIGRQGIVRFTVRHPKVSEYLGGKAMEMATTNVLDRRKEKSSRGAIWWKVGLW